MGMRRQVRRWRRRLRSRVQCIEGLLMRKIGFFDVLGEVKMMAASTGTPKPPRVANIVHTCPKPTSLAAPSNPCHPSLHASPNSR